MSREILIVRPLENLDFDDCVCAIADRIRAVCKIERYRSPRWPRGPAEELELSHPDQITVVLAGCESIPIRVETQAEDCPVVGTLAEAVRVEGPAGWMCTYGLEQGR